MSPNTAKVSAKTCCVRAAFELLHGLRLLNGNGGMIGEAGQQAHVPVREIARRAAVDAEGAARFAFSIDQRRDQGRHEAQPLHQFRTLHPRIGDEVERLGRLAQLHGGAEQAAVHGNRVGLRDRSGGRAQGQHLGIARIDFPDRGVLHVEQITHAFDQQRENFVGRMTHQLRGDFLDGVEQLGFLNGNDRLRG